MAKKKRKGTPWGPGNPLYDWKMKQKSNKSVKRRASTKKKVRNVAKKRRRGRRKFTLPIAAVGGLAMGMFINPVGGNQTPFERLTKGDFKWAIHEAIYNYTGYHGASGKWYPMNARGAFAAVGGFAIHKIASMLGINRTLGQAKVPILRI